MDVRFHEKSQVELSHAERHYDAGSSALALAFLDVVERAIARIRAFPESGGEHVGGTRRVVLDRFPYNLVYVLDEPGAVIVAVAHRRQTPAYWRTRL